MKDSVVESKSARSLFIGTVLTLLSNILYLGNNYIIKWGELSASEVGFVRSIIQITVFSGLFIREHNNKQKSFYYNNATKVYLCFYSFMTATSTFAIVAAIPFIPIDDLVVIAFTAPAFTVFFSHCILKSDLTPLKIFLSVSILAGNVFVVQPPIIFGNHKIQELEISKSSPINFSTTAISLHNQTMEFQILREKEMNFDRFNYYVGVCLCLYAAIAGSLARIFSTKLSSFGMSNNALMISSGGFMLLLSLAFIPLLPNRILNSQELSYIGYYCLPLAAINTVLAFWFLTLGLDYLRNPTLVGVLRSTEILFSLVSESFVDEMLPDPISLSGSLVVLVSVSCMTIHDWIIKFISTTITKVVKQNKNNPIESA